MTLWEKLHNAVYLLDKPANRFIFLNWLDINTLWTYGDQQYLRTRWSDALIFPLFHNFSHCRLCYKWLLLKRFTLSAISAINWCVCLVPCRVKGLLKPLPELERLLFKHHSHSIECELMTNPSFIGVPGQKDTINTLDPCVYKRQGQFSRPFYLSPSLEWRPSVSCSQQLTLQA